MKKLTRLFLMMALAAGCDPSSSIPPRDGGTSDSDIFDGPDADGDGISDEFEGASARTDTDGDGTPDYLDDDSDGDGRPDSEERGLGGGTTPPDDVDGDGTPDFRDLDADGNGIPDAEDGASDTDGDGAPDYRDRDDDGDTLTDVDEFGGDPNNPADFDGDGLPDYRDIDSDDDTIGDRYELSFDTDADETIDRQDLDSDGDGWTDEEEGGDGDPLSPPPDTDGDMIFDFRDPDSDGDGLSDARERELGTARDNADTDMDGVTDLVEIAACEGAAMGPVMTDCSGDALDPDSSPRTRGDFVFFMPFEQPADPTRDTLDFATDIQVADVYFVVDTTGSMSGGIAGVRTSLSAPGGIIESVQARIPDVQFGVGAYRDVGDAFLYQNRQDITASTAAAQTAVNGLVHGGGGDTPEGGIVAIHSTISGIGSNANPRYGNRSGCPAGTFGYPCFREGAVPIIVAIADAVFHNGSGGGSGRYPLVGGGNADFASTVAALNAARAKVVGVAVTSGANNARPDLEALARATGSVDAADTPFVSSTSGAGVGTTVVDQIQALAGSLAFDISVRFDDDPSDEVDTNVFVDRLEANTAGDAGRGCEARAAIDSNADGVLDTFEQVRGDRVCFDIVPAQNDTVMPSEEPQVFEANVTVIGDGFTELDSRKVFFLVPPTVRDPGIPI